MKHTVSKIFRALCGMDTILFRVMSIAVMLALMAGITSVPASAASNGIYIATASPHYKHPTTGKIEDSGGEGSSVLGQSMTESATYKQALVEVDSQGNTYVTIRLQLMDNIQNPQFQVDASRNGSFSAVSATLMQEDYTKNTADYRMKVPSENAVIRCNMYVSPMGRDVIFYITVSNLQSGSGDFITSVKMATQKPSETSKPVETQKPAETQKPIATSVPVMNTSEVSVPRTDAFTPERTEPVSPEPSPSEIGVVVGLQEFDASGNKVEDSSEEAKTQSGHNNAIIWWVLIGFVVVAVTVGCVWYFCFFKKKR